MKPDVLGFFALHPVRMQGFGQQILANAQGSLNRRYDVQGDCHLYGEDQG